VSGRRLSVGIDIGGTFTDVVLVEEGIVGDAADGARLFTAKALTTPDDPADGALAALDLALAEAGADAADVERSVHATTLATNVVLERRGANVGYVTTEGFGDLLVIGEERRGDADKFNLQYVKQAPLVPRRRTVEVSERLDARGEVVRPLDEARAEAVITDLLAREPVEALAVCLLHAHANPAHEQAIAALVQRIRPDLHVTLSSEVWGEYRELPRANTTVVSAYVAPTVGRYLANLEDRLRARGVRPSLQVMQSSGGTTSVAATTRRPIQLVESGPAAGVIAAAYVGGRCGIDDLISFDMGGTTAKAGLVQGGRPTIVNELTVGGSTSVGQKRVNTGWDVKLPVIDLAEVGAGGGSLATVDTGGILRVGPDSAGSVPGPACYGRGGTRPTVTDANVVLGYVNPDYFLGGTMAVDASLARAAIEEHIGRPLGFDVVRAAAGIHEIVNANMAAAIRMVTVERGIDPRRFTLVASGGAGPAHAARLAEVFDIPEVLVLADAGVGSAIGLLASDVVVDAVRTKVVPLASDGADADADVLAALDDIYASLVAGAVEQVAAQGFDPARTRVERTIDVRFHHQAHEMSVPLAGNADTPLTAADLATAGQAFRDLYAQLYGVRPEDALELVNYRVRAVGLVDKPDRSTTARATGPAVAVATRPVYFEEDGRHVDTPVFRRASLAPGHVIEGPAMIEEPMSSIVIPPGRAAELDDWRNIRIRAK
jgi:N-methylhydantoinase A